MTVTLSEVCAAIHDDLTLRGHAPVVVVLNEDREFADAIAAAVDGVRSEPADAFRRYVETGLPVITTWACGDLDGVIEVVKNLGARRPRLSLFLPQIVVGDLTHPIVSLSFGANDESTLISFMVG